VCCRLGKRDAREACGDGICADGLPSPRNDVKRKAGGMPRERARRRGGGRGRGVRGREDARGCEEVVGNELLRIALITAKRGVVLMVPTRWPGEPMLGVSSCGDVAAGRIRFAGVCGKRLSSNGGGAGRRLVDFVWRNLAIRGCRRIGVVCREREREKWKDGRAGVKSYGGREKSFRFKGGAVVGGRRE